MFRVKEQSSLCMRNSNREDESTVSLLFFLTSFKLIFSVRGTPGSGRSVLTGLLRRHINEKVPNAEVVFCQAWPEKQPVQTIPHTILILDEA
jgi:Cdc6-like AAA superfamily ATPase